MKEMRACFCGCSITNLFASSRLSAQYQSDMSESVNCVVFAYINTVKNMVTLAHKYSVVTELFRYLVSPAAAELAPDSRASLRRYATNVRVQMSDLSGDSVLSRHGRGLSLHGRAALLSALSDFETGAVRRQSRRQRDIRLARIGAASALARSWEGREFACCAR